MSSIESLADDIANLLQDYSDGVTKGVKKAVDKTGKEVNEEIKRHITFNQPTGDYVKSFALKTTYEDTYSKKKKWYVKAPHYRLTHLLEKGHITKNGRKVRAYPHIEYGEKLAEKNLVEHVKEAIQGD